MNPSIEDFICEVLWSFQPGPQTVKTHLSQKTGRPWGLNEGFWYLYGISIEIGVDAVEWLEGGWIKIINRGEIPEITGI